MIKATSVTEYLCPICGKGKTHLKKMDYKLCDEKGKEFTVPNIEVEICDFCGEQIFNMEAVRKARQAQGTSRKIMIRLQPKMHDALASRARNSKRSIAQEAHHLLVESLRAAN